MITKTITFHAAHNYGSMLQAYALQQTLKAIGVDNEIINFRSKKQRDMYTRNGVPRNSNVLKKAILTAFSVPFTRSLRKKYELFEQFLSENLVLTKEYNDAKDLHEDKLTADCYIAGGDQIWKPRCYDFDWTYYLNFVETTKCISYGVSMGPKESEVQEFRGEISKQLQKFSSIGVREPGTASVVRGTTAKEAVVNLDPVFLLDKKDWETLIGNKTLINEPYYFMYVPMYKKEVYDIAKMLQQKTGKRVVISQVPIKALTYTSFTKKLDVGPREFLNLLINAELVISGSFHALAFCMLLHKPFMGVNANNDNRSKDLLASCHLENCSVNINDALNKLENVLHSDFSCADNYFKEERGKCIEFLKKAIYG